MRVLLFEPWHKHALYYLAKTMNDWTFYYCGSLQWGNLYPDPNGPKNVIPIEENEIQKLNIDAKILVFSFLEKHYKRILEKERVKNDFPIIWRTYWADIQEPIDEGYPVLYGYYTPNHSPYLRKYSTILDPPDPSIWNNWIGSHRTIVSYGDKRIPFDEYRESFRKGRVYFESSRRPLSFSLLEAMTIGMPVVIHEQDPNSRFGLVVRNGIDGYCSKDKKFILEKLSEFLDDYPLAREFGFKSQKRIFQLANYDRVRKTWEWAFQNAKENWKKLREGT